MNYFNVRIGKQGCFLERFSYLHLILSCGIWDEIYENFINSKKVADRENACNALKQNRISAHRHASIMQIDITEYLLQNS